jgi:alkanesulfonate monooxygenase SsuD/methylene tetrahydromethanopterin reductase-like flavin-dependent oxidoreductase (luciferase family)
MPRRRPACRPENLLRRERFPAGAPSLARFSFARQLTAHLAGGHGRAVAVGERHAGPFLSAGTTVVLGAIAAATSRVRIQTGVCVLSVLDPLRVAEDYATIDQLSRGRLELVIGKGNELRQLPMFGVEPGEQWDQLAEKYALLRRLWREENVTWEGKFRGPLEAVTSLPRPFAGAPRVWHGSATTLTSAALAATWGDPLFSANAIWSAARSRSSTRSCTSTRPSATTCSRSACRP